MSKFWIVAIVAIVAVAVVSCGTSPSSGGFAAGSLAPPSGGAESSSAKAETAPGAAAATKELPPYELVWSDEFDLDGLPDPTKWDYDVGGHGWGNQELQYYTDDGNAFVRDGNLVIELRQEERGGRDYTSARVVSRRKGDWLYGRFEVRARVPAGLGTWPAIWMLPTDWRYGNWPASGEIDIMEHVGYDPGVVHGSVHTERFNHMKGTQVSGTISVPDATEEFHVYAVEWTPDRIKFFVDGEEYHRFSPFVQRPSAGFEEWPFDKRFHLLLNIAFGGSWGGARGIDPDILPVTMEVDYVRVYQRGPEN